MTILDYYNKEKQRFLENCIQCGLCAEGCPILPYTDISEISTQDIQEGVFDFMDGGIPNQHAYTKAFACMECFKCTTDMCPEDLNPMLVNEFIKAAATYPIVFLKVEDDFKPFAMLGIEQGENFFLGEDGKWKLGYIPAVLRRYPFVLGKSGESQTEMMICIDEESDYVSESEGEPLFDGEGKPGQIMENAKKFLTELHQFNDLTGRFSKKLKDLELFQQLDIKVKTPDGQNEQNITGCFGINESKLNELPDADFLELRKFGAIPLIYTQMVSLGQIERLMRLKNERTKS